MIAVVTSKMDNYNGCGFGNDCNHNDCDNTLMNQMSIIIVIIMVTVVVVLISPTLTCLIIFIQGQEPHLPTALASASPQEAKQMLGERLFPLIQQTHPDLAGKITGMLLEIDNAELLHMLESREALNAKVDEAVNVLKAHQAKDTLAAEGQK